MEGLGSFRRMIRETERGAFVSRLYANTPTYPPSRQVLRRQERAEAKMIDRRNWRKIIRANKEQPAGA